MRGETLLLAQPVMRACDADDLLRQLAAVHQGRRVPVDLIVDKLEDDSRAWMRDKAEGYDRRLVATTSRQRSASATGAEAL